MVSSTTPSTRAATRNRARIEGYPPSTARFEWIATILSMIFMIGLYIDGWAHNHGEVDQSFFTVWHAIFYSGFGLCGLFLTWNATQNMGKGYAMARSLPPGYVQSLAGLFVFGIGGVGDLTWHTLFGIEDGTDALLSPTHLLLAIGMGLIWSGPLRSAFSRIAAKSTPGWKQVGPAIISATLLLALFMFFTQFAHPMVNPVAQIGGTEAGAASSDIYVMNADGSRQTRLTSQSITGNVFNPALSPDGSKILYTYYDPVTELPDMFIMNNDGTNTQPLVAHGEQESLDSGAWSPDGKQIAFTLSKGETASDRGLYIVNADGSNITTIISKDVEPGVAWSPDGTQIAYVSKLNGNSDIMVANADGSNPSVVIAGPSEEIQPAFSPNGTKIAYTLLNGNEPAIMVANRDGSNAVQIVTGGFSPTWSSDGQHIVFVGLGDEQTVLMTVKADGGEATNISNNANLQVRGANFTPDGTQIIYAAEMTSNSAGEVLLPYGIGNILLQSGIMMGILLLLVRQWSLPFGALTFILTASSLLISTQNDTYLFVPVMLVAGLVGDVLLRWWKPAQTGAWRFYGFGFVLPIAVYIVYFIVMQLTLGIGWSIHGVGGAIFLAGVVGFFAAVVMQPPTPAAQTLNTA